jgi:predicted deacetylase
VVRHSCDNPGCWEITHLQAGTQKENAQDMIERGRQNWYRKLTSEDVEEIARRYLTGEKPVSIAHDFNIHKNYVTRIMRRSHPELTRSRKGKGRWGKYAQGENAGAEHS